LEEQIINNLKKNKMETTIKTSEVNWFERAINCYKEKRGFTFIDDVNLGIIEKDLISAINLIKSGKMTWKNICGVLAGIGISTMGIYIIRLAILDPEPTTKLGLLITGGLVLTVTGSFAILYSLGVNLNVTAKSKFGEFVVSPG
jgi:hypothetical protein